MHRHLYISFQHFVCQGKGEVKKKNTSKDENTNT